MSDQTPESDPWPREQQQGGSRQQQGSQQQRPPRQRPPRAEQSSSSAIKYIVIGAAVLFGALPILGCVAALAIPAFITYMNRAHAEEAQAVTAELADQIVADAEDNCELPPELPATGDPADCCGGDICSYDPRSLEAWDEAGFDLHETEGRFVYGTRWREDTDAYEVYGKADFGCNDLRNHTHIIVIEPVEGEECGFRTLPAYTENEFQ